MSKLYKIALAIVALVLVNMTAFAQAPCSGDPDDPGYSANGCPIDTYVIVLAVVAVVFGYKHLQKQNGLVKSV